MDVLASACRLLEYHWRRVRFARTDRAEDAEVARQDALVLALQRNAQLRLPGEVAQHHVAVEAVQLGDLTGTEREHGRTGNRPRVGVARAAADEFALDFEIGEEKTLQGGVGGHSANGGRPGTVKEWPRDDLGEEAGTRPVLVLDTDVLVALHQAPVGDGCPEQHALAGGR